MGTFLEKNNIKNTFTKKNITQNNLMNIKCIESLRLKYNSFIVSAISPLRKTKNFSKKKFKNNYYETYVKSFLKTLILRGTKGLYKLALKNKIDSLVGFRLKIRYELSRCKVLTINTSRLSKDQSLKKVLCYLNLM